MYLRQDTTASRALTDSLVDLYTTTMVYLSKAKSYFDSHSMKRIVESGLFGKSELENHLSSIREKEEITIRCSDVVDAETQIADHESMAALLARINGPLNRMNEDLKTMKDHFERSKREDILFWISSQPYPQHHEQTKKGLVRGTGQWLLQDPVFQNWKDGSTSSILWLHGIPGSGKSKLASIVIEDAISLFKESESPSPAFF